jgi:hypothetical protein
MSPNDAETVTCAASKTLMSARMESVNVVSVAETRGAKDRTGNLPQTTGASVHRALSAERAARLASDHDRRS